MGKDKIAYNPYLMVAENAVNNKVSVYQIRKYIRVNGIDRKRDNAIIIHRRIKDAVKKNPDLSIRELSRRLHLAVNTV